MKKLTNKKGFTLVEMLIVVAIMIVLVAVAIPTFSTQVDKANRAADLANERSAKAVATTEYLANDLEAGTYPFIAETGKLGTKGGETSGYGKSTNVKGDYIIVTISDGEITVGWKKGGKVS